MTQRDLMMCQGDCVSSVVSAVTNSVLLCSVPSQGFAQDPAFGSPFTAARGHVLCEAQQSAGGCVSDSAKHRERSLG